MPPQKRFKTTAGEGVQSSIRFDRATVRQLEALQVAGWGTITKIVAVAIDRMYQQEFPPESEPVTYQFSMEATDPIHADGAPLDEVE